MNIAQVKSVHTEMLDKLQEVSRHYAEEMRRFEIPMRDMQRMAEKAFEPTRRIIEAISVKEKDMKKLFDAMASNSILEIVTSDLDKADHGHSEINEEGIKSTVPIDDQALDYADMVNEVIDEVSDTKRASRDLRLGPSGKLFIVDDREVSKPTSPQMHALIRTLTKKYCKTSKLTVACGYKSDDVTRRSIQKLNGWGYGVFKFEYPIVVGAQGEGYKLNAKLRLHKVPKSASLKS